MSENPTPQARVLATYRAIKGAASIAGLVVLGPVFQPRLVATNGHLLFLLPLEKDIEEETTGEADVPVEKLRNVVEAYLSAATIRPYAEISRDRLAELTGNPTSVLSSACPECRGEGEVQGTCSCPDCGGHRIECPECDGEGVVGPTIEPVWVGEALVNRAYLAHAAASLPSGVVSVGHFFAQGYGCIHLKADGIECFVMGIRSDDADDAPTLNLSAA